MNIESRSLLARPMLLMAFAIAPHAGAQTPAQMEYDRQQREYSRIHKVSATPFERGWGASDTGASPSDQGRGCNHDVSPAHPGRTIRDYRAAYLRRVASGNCAHAQPRSQHDQPRTAAQSDAPRR